MGHPTVPYREEGFDAAMGAWGILMMFSVFMFWLSAGENWGAGAEDPTQQPYLQAGLGLSAGLGTLFTVITIGLFAATHLNVRQRQVNTATFAAGATGAAFCALVAWAIASIYSFTEGYPICDHVAEEAATQDLGFEGSCSWVFATEAFALLNTIISTGVVLWSFLTFREFEGF
mmetsp:Transcript_11289/g.35836  ORF Transcript_11289/g.35836 Transcript_11289/m.35836 type:complete len:174 (-) Transcript_11289:59-580(-)